MQLGTYNKQLSVIIKDKIKEVLFFFKKKNKIKSQINSDETSFNDKFNICNKLIGVHQSEFEIVELAKILNTQLSSLKIICEIGTANGGTSLLLGFVLKNLKQVLCIDLYVKNSFVLNGLLSKSRVSIINGSSYNDKTIKKVSKILNNKTIDFLFIDGDHQYDGVKKDFEYYLPFMSPNGIIAFHDIVPDYLTKFGTKTGMWVGDVPKFWKEIKEHYNFKEIIEDQMQDGKGIGILFL